MNSTLYSELIFQFQTLSLSTQQMISRMDTDLQVTTFPNDNPIVQKYYLVAKLIFLGLLLPAIDLATDLYAIYQYWTSNQWILKYMAKGLAFSIFCHNFTSTWYGWRNWPDPLAWNFSKLLCLSLGFGNIRLAMEILADITWKKNVEAR